MKALVFHGPGERQWETVPDAGIQDPTDVVVRIDSSTICGTDLHILKGDVPAVKPGTVLGHEAVGTVVETASSSRASPRVGAAASARKATTGSASEAEAGSSDI
jgi:alcohol dehydrogenase